MEDEFLESPLPGDFGDRLEQGVWGEPRGEFLFPVVGESGFGVGEDVMREVQPGHGPGS